MTAVICDADRKWMDEATEILNEVAEELGTEVKIVCFGSIDELRRALKSSPDMLFINIDLFKESRGSVLAQTIILLADRITSQAESMSAGSDWLIPRSGLRESLPDIIRKAQLTDDDDRSEVIIRTTDGVVTKIPCSEIIYLERSNRRTMIVTADNKYTVRSRLPEILEKLPAEGFARCHASFAVNLEKVREIRSKNLVMNDGTSLMISRGFSKSFRLKYMNLAEKRMVQ